MTRTAGRSLNALLSVFDDLFAYCFVATLFFRSACARPHALMAFSDWFALLALFFSASATLVCHILLLLSIRA
jgi:hypothetical protein